MISLPRIYLSIFVRYVPRIVECQINFYAESLTEERWIQWITSRMKHHNVSWSFVSKNIREARISMDKERWKKETEKNGNERYTWLRRFAMKMRSFEFQSELCKTKTRLSIRGNCTSTGKNWKTLGISVPFDILCWPFEPMVPRIIVFSLARSSPKMYQRRRRFVFLKTIKLHCCPRLSRNTFRLTLGWKLSLE